MLVEFKRLEHGEGLDLPAYESVGASGMDIRSAVDLTLQPGHRHLTRTGFAIAIQDGYEVQVRPRSGLAHKHGITVVNTPGTIDMDYRGEVLINLYNGGGYPVKIVRGERIAQLVVAPVIQATTREVEEFSTTTERGANGFGSTGRN